MFRPRVREEDTPPGDADRPAAASRDRLPAAVLLLLVAIPIGVNARALLPELTLRAPNLNDTAFHFLLVQRASEALAQGEHPLDHWVPELELGFPQFFYYQHLPHVVVVLLHRLLLQQVDLLTLFDLTRYLLLVLFPLTVYWSMRRLDCSAPASAVAAATASLLSSDHRYGFEYDSYLWRGLGMYTQLWAMHLSFLTLACLDRVLERGVGYPAAVASASTLALSHLVYSYMMVGTALALFAVGATRSNTRVRAVRLGVVGGLAAAASSYMWLPFLFHTAYLSASPYLQRWKYDSFGARQILTWLVNGDLLDFGRLPVLTLLLALGVAAALRNRTRAASLALALFFAWLALYFGRPTWGRLADLLPLHEGLLFHRFIGGVNLAAIILIGLGGEWIWREAGRLPARGGPVIAGIVLLGLLAPALRERHRYYALNTQWMTRTRAALDADQDARAIRALLKTLPPGRTYAGLRANWGDTLRFGDVRFFNVLTFDRIVALSPPYQSLSLNADLIWHFDDQAPAHYSLFNVRHVVAPSQQSMPSSLRRIRETRRYTLYEVTTGGYAQFAAIAETRRANSQAALFLQNRQWLFSDGPTTGRFLRWDYPARAGDAGTPPSGAGHGTSGSGSACPDGGRVSEERVLPGLIDLTVECPKASTIVLKLTYHPNWRAQIDGAPRQPFMVSPSFIGLDVPPGPHQVRFEYRPPPYKSVLLLLGACAMFAPIWLRRVTIGDVSRSRAGTSPESTPPARNP